jgi:hypothetical protein
MTCPRTATHEETELLTVPRIPFRARIPNRGRVLDPTPILLPSVFRDLVAPLPQRGVSSASSLLKRAALRSEARKGFLGPIKVQTLAAKRCVFGL